MLLKVKSFSIYTPGIKDISSDVVFLTDSFLSNLLDNSFVVLGIFAMLALEYCKECDAVKLIEKELPDS